MKSSDAFTLLFGSSGTLLRLMSDCSCGKVLGSVNVFPFLYNRFHKTYWSTMEFDDVHLVIDWYIYNSTYVPAKSKS